MRAANIEHQMDSSHVTLMMMICVHAPVACTV